MLPVRRHSHDLWPVHTFSPRHPFEEPRGVHVAVVIGPWLGEPSVGVRHHAAAKIRQLVKASLKPL